MAAVGCAWLPSQHTPRHCPSLPVSCHRVSASAWPSSSSSACCPPAWPGEEEAEWVGGSEGSQGAGRAAPGDVTMSLLCRTDGGMFRSSWGSSRGSASPSRTSASRFNSYSGGRGRSTSSGGFGLGLGGGLLLGYSLSRPGYGPGYGYGYGNNYNYQRRNNYDTTRSVSL